MPENNEQQPIALSPVFPLRYKKADSHPGFDLYDDSGALLGTAGNEGFAKLLTEFPNKFMRLLQNGAKASRGWRGQGFG